MLNYIETQRAKMLSMDHPFINNVNTLNTKSQQLDELLTVKTKVSDTIKLQSHTFVEVKNN